tara:strand:+ start:204 stop:1253 length:1050 start_codon:yes stop_codon:yes gene_type:complete
MNYKEKYLKYKLKYLNLRNKFSGGMEDDSMLKGGGDDDDNSMLEDDSNEGSDMASGPTSEMPESSNIEVPQIDTQQLLVVGVSNIGQLEFINNQFQFNTITGIINARPECVNPDLVPCPYTHHALTHVVNLGKAHFYKKYGKSIAENKYKYFQDLLRISKSIPNYLLIKYSYFNTHTNIESLLEDIGKMYNSYYDKKTGEMTDKGNEFLRMCGFGDDEMAAELGNGFDASKYLINIAKIHLQHVIDTLKSLKNTSGVELNYYSAIEYFKVTLTDFLKIGFINKFLEIDEGVYKDTLESYNMLVTDTGTEVLRTMGVQMISDLDMDHFINNKVQFLWEAEGIPGTPKIVI